MPAYHSLQLTENPVLFADVFDQLKLCFAPVHIFFFIEVVCLENVIGLEIILCLEGDVLQPGESCPGYFQIMLDPVDRVLINRSFLLGLKLYITAKVDQTVDALINISALFRCVFCVLLCQLGEAFRRKDPGLKLMSVCLLSEICHDGLKSCDHFFVCHNLSPSVFFVLCAVLLCTIELCVIHMDKSIHTSPSLSHNERKLRISLIYSIYCRTGCGSDCTNTSVISSGDAVILPRIHSQVRFTVPRQYSRI